MRPEVHIIQDNETLTPDQELIKDLSTKLAKDLNKTCEAFSHNLVDSVSAEVMVSVVNSGTGSVALNVLRSLKPLIGDEAARDLAQSLVAQLDLI